MIDVAWSSGNAASNSAKFFFKTNGTVYVGLTEALVGLRFETDRLKTGTPARVDSRTVNFSGLEEQPGRAPCGMNIPGYLLPHARVSCKNSSNTLLMAVQLSGGQADAHHCIGYCSAAKNPHVQFLMLIEDFFYLPFLIIFSGKLSNLDWPLMGQDIYLHDAYSELGEYCHKLWCSA